MFIPVSDEILNSDKPLTNRELYLLEKSVDESEKIINMCTDNDQDILEYHDAYLTKVIERIEKSMKIKRGLRLA